MNLFQKWTDQFDSDGDGQSPNRKFFCTLQISSNGSTVAPATDMAPCKGHF